MPSELPDIVACPWWMFLEWFDEVWEAGQHLAIIGPTGEGKTTIAVPILQMRKWLIALDPKGEDETLAKSGFLRITRLPLPRKIRNDVAEGKPARIILGGKSDSKRADNALRNLMHEALEMVRAQGGWAIYADEFQILSDRKMFNLGDMVERLLISARSKGTSVITSYQAPAWVPKAALRQVSFVILTGNRDPNLIKSVAESMGREWRDLVAMVQKLPRWHAIVIPKSLHDPIVIVHPPKL